MWSSDSFGEGISKLLPMPGIATTSVLRAVLRLYATLTSSARRSSSADGSVMSSLTRGFVARIVADRDEPTMNAKQLIGLFIHRIVVATSFYRISAEVAFDKISAVATVHSI